MAGDDGNKTPPSSPGKSAHSKGGDGAGGSGKEEVVRVVREIGGPANWPLLTKTNYTDWSLLMKIKMQARNLWDAIEPGGVSLQVDRLALDAITNAVPPEMVSSLAVKDTAQEAWEAVKSMRIGSESVRKTKAQRLRREFESIRFNDGEAVDDFTLRLSNLVAALGTVGETIEPVKVVEKLLRVVPKRLSQVAVAIEVTADLSTLTLEDVGGRLRAAEDRATEDDEPPPARADGKLYLTEKQWEARWRQRRGKESARSGGARHGDGDRKGSHNGGHEDDDDDDGGSSVSSGASRRRRSSGKGKCFNCGVRGHFSRECPKLRKEEALLADADDEPTLL